MSLEIPAFAGMTWGGRDDVGGAGMTGRGENDVDRVVMTCRELEFR